MRALHDPGLNDPATHGARAVRLARLAALGLPVPPGLALPVELVARIARDGARAALGDALDRALAGLGAGALLAIRASPPDPDWGGPHAILDIGITDAALPALSARIGARAARDLYRRLIQSWGAAVAGIDAEAFETALHERLKLEGADSEGDLDCAALERLVADYRGLFRAETGEDFPQDPAAQLGAALEAAARGWMRPSARMLRDARGAPRGAGLALIVQRMALG
ncbi:MAG: hypothetical protein D6686_07125, partial [Alphaproteobacteria bacterium]